MHETGLHETRRERRESATTWAVGAIILAGIALSALLSFQLLFVLVELFCVVIACAIFSVVWHSRGFSDTPFFLFLGTSSLGIGCIWLMHTLASMGMLDALGDGRRIALCLQIESRLLLSGMFFAAPFFVGRRPRGSLMLIASVLVTAAAVALAIMLPSRALGVWQSSGLQSLSGFIACFLLAGGMIHLAAKRHGFDKRVLVLLLVSIGSKVIAELALAFAAADASWLTEAGSFFRLASAFILFRAVVSTALENPYRLLFHGTRHAKDDAVTPEEKALKGILSICMSCKKIRVHDDDWQQIDSYISAHSNVEFSHGICPDCAQKVFADMTHEGTA